MLTMQVIGNLGQDPEEKTTESGTRLCRFSIAANKKIKGEKITTWVNVTVFDTNKIDFIMRYVTKGTKMFLEGEPQARAYLKDGEARHSLDLILSYNSKAEICSSDSAEERSDYAGSNTGSVASGATQDDNLNDDIPW